MQQYIQRKIMGQNSLWRLGIFFLVFGCTASSDTKQLPAAQRQYFKADWAQHKLWDDGLAEVATYQAQRVVYNKSRSFDYTLITVKEDFNRAHNVKTDDYTRSDLFPVIKVNQFCRIPTENYPYHYLTSLFFRRENPVQVHKITSSSQEWCGNTFKAITSSGDNYQYAFNSYWDGQGEGKLEVPGNILFEDQLPYTLRSLQFKDGLQFKMEVAELLQTSKATKPTIYPAVFIISSDKTSSPAGLWLVTVNLSTEKQNKYWFRKEYPNILVKQQTWDGRLLDLKVVKRYAYWQK